MKTLALVSVLSLSVSFAADAALQQTKEVKFVGDMAYAGFCKAVVNDNVSLFKRSVKRFVGPLGGNQQLVLTKVLENDNVKCAGQGIAKFAKERDAQQISAFIADAE